MITARIVMAPAGPLLSRLQAVAEMLTTANVAWLQEQVERGRTPPVSTLRCAPPWSRDRVRYVPHHGAPLDNSRTYHDGPTMFAAGRGTCIEVCAYDAAVWLHGGVQARAAVEQVDAANFHCVLVVAGRRFDPSNDLERATT
jgi:hypothetical protein